MVGCVPEDLRFSAVGENCVRTADCIPDAVCRDLECHEKASLCPDAPLFEVDGVLFSTGCPVDRGTCFTTDKVERRCICREQGECGDGFSCVRGPGCYCACAPPGTVANPDCGDPFCQDVKIEAD